MRRLKLTLAYDGSKFSGFQYQENANAVQNELEKALKKIASENSRVVPAGRTDAGVHALGQVAHFDAVVPLAAEKLAKALNSALPSSIAVQHCEEVSDSFHARFSAKSKEYVYVVLNRQIHSPFLRAYALHVPQNLDVENMKKAASFFTGEHDFASFQNTGTETKTSLCHVLHAEVNTSADFLLFHVRADRFLYGMVRSMAGTLLEVALKKRSPESIPELLRACDRSLSGPTAPPQGLYLVRVNY